ncbi:MAG: hypothetical protein AB7F35_17345 [Acetobacteraceae bacterium]
MRTIHKFKVGDAVNLSPARHDGDVPPGAYRVERLLPVEGRDVRYRIRSERDGHERVVMEDRLSQPSLG